MNKDKLPPQQAADTLRAAWDDMIASLQQARDVIDQPQYAPPAASDRVLAEGYRYLSGFMHHAIERAFHEDPARPAFRNALSVYNKATIDNADAIYFYAPIDGRKRYKVTATLPDCRHWQGQPRTEQGALAPQYLIFEVTGGPIAGDTGDLRELMSGSRCGFGALDISQLQIGDDNTLEILLAPERPEGYTGNFFATRKPPSSRAPENGDRYATYISGRQLFYDWAREVPVPLTITALDDEGLPSTPLDSEHAAAKLRRIGEIVSGQMRFWQAFYDRVLNCHQRYDDDGRYYMPVNAYNQPNAASGATGGGMSTNIYAGGMFDLAEDEALYIEARYYGDPVYTGLHLGNLWGESPDYANHQSSLNGFQMHDNGDGVQRWVVAHCDPGVPNWIDTTGLPQGYLSNRWAYSTLPPKAQWPTIQATKIAFDEIAAMFPEGTPHITPAQRRHSIAVRQQHVQSRFRVF